MSVRLAEWPANFPISDWKLRNASIAIDEFVASQLLTFQLRSVVGERGKWSGGRNEAHSEMKPERSVPPPSRRRKPAALAAFRRMPARDERAVCGAERAWSRGGQGRPAARGEKQTVRWSRRIRDDGCVRPIVCAHKNSHPTSNVLMRQMIARILRVSVELALRMMEDL